MVSSESKREQDRERERERATDEPFCGLSSANVETSIGCVLIDSYICVLLDLDR
jgi:hypothetical protein